jgi:hypothetical protein
MKHPQFAEGHSRFLTSGGEAAGKTQFKINQ